MAALEAGRDAGGQHGGQRSAAILVYGAKTFAEVDLRVDLHREPVGELRRIYDEYKLAIPYYNLRQVDATVPPLDDWLERRGSFNLPRRRHPSDLPRRPTASDAGSHRAPCARRYQTGPERPRPAERRCHSRDSAGPH